MTASMDVLRRNLKALAPALALALAGCQHGGEGAQVSGAGAGEGAKPAETAALPELAGPKRTVAVGKFDAIGSFVQKYGDWDIGGGLAAMLTSALAQSDRFVVVERAELAEVLSEQEMKASGIVNPETGPKLGKLAGVQYLIYGAVTEFGTDDKGGGLSVGLAGLGGGRSPFTLGGAQQSASGKVAMDIRIVDTTTGEVVETHTLERAIDSSAFNISAGYSGVSLGTEQFDKTPLGAATRGAIQQAVARIAATAAKRPWVGLVVDVEGREVSINAGSRSGLGKGDLFMVERVTKTFTDPATGQVLGSRTRPLGVLELSDVQERLAFGAYRALEPEPPKRGDRVVVMKK